MGLPLEERLKQLLRAVSVRLARVTAVKVPKRRDDRNDLEWT